MNLRRLGLLVTTTGTAFSLGFGPCATVQAQPEPTGKSPDPAKVENPSWFKKDKDGVLWFQQGDDGQTKYSASLVLSAMRDTIVITVTANERHIKDALLLAGKMRGVLQKSQHTPDEIPIVAWTDELPGIGYSFYTDGMRVDLDTIGKQGVYRPSDAKRKEVLRETMMQYKLLMTEYVPKGKWGEDDHKMIALKIVGQY